MTDKNLLILVVDGDPTFLKVWDKVLRSFKDCRYHLTDSAEQALEILKKEPVSILISEVVLSKKSGYALAEEVVHKNPNAKVILTTAYECALHRFNLSKPQFHILYKPYIKIEAVINFLGDIIYHRDPRTDITIDEDSWSENEVYPSVMEWKL